MKKNDLKKLLQVLLRSDRNNTTFNLSDNPNRTLVQHLTHFFNSDFCNQKTDNDEISFRDFFNFMLEHANDFKILFTEIDINPTLSQFMKKWQAEMQPNELQDIKQWANQENPNKQTFMGTNIAEIPLARLIFLDGRFEDVAEISEYLKSRIEYGSELFTNPNTHNPIRSYSDAAKRKIRQHPVTASVIEEHERKMKDYSEIVLSDKFCDALRKYLLKLHEIGVDGNPGTIHYENNQSKIEKCQAAKVVFFEELHQNCSQDEMAALKNATQIKLPFKRVENSPHRPETSVVGFMQLATGRDAYSCVITQQIYLWAMLRELCPATQVPDEVIDHWQAQHYDLGASTRNVERELPSILPEDIIIEQGVNIAPIGLHGFFNVEPTHRVPEFQPSLIDNIQQNRAGFFTDFILHMEALLGDINNVENLRERESVIEPVRPSTSSIVAHLALFHLSRFVVSRLNPETRQSPVMRVLPNLDRRAF